MTRKPNTRSDSDEVDPADEMDAAAAAWLAPADDDDDLLVLDTDLGPVTIRALTRHEVFQVETHKRDGSAGREARSLVMGVVSPKLNYDQWLQAIRRRKSGEIGQVVDALVEHSGMDTAAARRAAREEFRDG